jgi:hypothetical protein
VSIVVTLLLVVSVAVNVWFLRRRPNEGNRSVRSTLMQGMRNVRELTTLRQNFQSVVMYEGSKALLGFSVPGTARKFILKYSGTLTCGSDLSKVQISERFGVNRVHIAVPRSALLDLYADMNSIQVYDQRAGLFTSIQLQDMSREIAADLEQVRRDAEQGGGVLRRADENTRLALSLIASSMGMEADVTFFGEPEPEPAAGNAEDAPRAEPAGTGEEAPASEPFARIPQLENTDR